VPIADFSKGLHPPASAPSRLAATGVYTTPGESTSAALLSRCVHPAEIELVLGKRNGFPVEDSPDVTLVNYRVTAYMENWREGKRLQA